MNQNSNSQKEQLIPEQKVKQLVRKYYGVIDDSNTNNALDMYYTMLELVTYYEQNFNITPKELT